MLPIFMSVEASSIETAFQTALTGMNETFMGLVLIALPVGLGIFAVYFAVKKGLQFFKVISK